MPPNPYNVVEVLFEPEDSGEALRLPSSAPGVYNSLILRDAQRMLGLPATGGPGGDIYTTPGGQVQSRPTPNAANAYNKPVPADAYNNSAPGVAYNKPVAANTYNKPVPAPADVYNLPSGAAQSRNIAPPPLRSAPAGPTPDNPTKSLKGSLPTMDMKNHGFIIDKLKQIRNGDEGDTYSTLYRTAERLGRSQIEVGYRLKRSGELFDTEALQKKFDNRIAAGGKGSEYNRGQAKIEFQSLQDMAAWATKGCIWVCVSDGASGGRFYSAVGKRFRTHHSSLSGGGSVVGAGEWIVEKGQLLRISATSGHYQPTLDSLVQSVRLLTSAHTVKTRVWMFDVQGKAFVDRKVTDFLASPSDGGRFKVNPAAS